MSPSTFTSGPRGRRVLLELAAMASQEIENAVFERTFAINREQGSSVWAFGWVDGEARSGPEFEADLAANAPTPAHIGELLDALPRTEHGPDESMFWEALRRSVDAAMYWQEPDGQDALASMRELRGPLRRFAAWAAPFAPPQWDAPMSTEQFAIVWFDQPIDPGLSQEGWKQQTLESEERAKAELDSDPNANYTGTWWSTPAGVVSSGTHRNVPTGLMLAEDFSGGPAKSAPVDASSARILTIDNTSAWNTLCWDQPLEVTASRRHDWYRVTGTDGRWVIPDWSQLAKKYDAVHMSYGAYLAGATQLLTVDTGIYTMIAGWGPGETRWLNPPDIGEETTWEWDPDEMTWEESAESPGRG